MRSLFPKFEKNISTVTLFLRKIQRNNMHWLMQSQKE